MLYSTASAPVMCDDTVTAAPFLKALFGSDRLKLFTAPGASEATVSSVTPDGVVTVTGMFNNEVVPWF